MRLVLGFCALVGTALLSGSALTQPSAPPSAIRDAGTTADGRWHWITVEPSRSSPTGWEVQTGEAEVTIDRGNFQAELHQPRGQAGADISLYGRIIGGMIRAREILRSTDASPMVITGSLKRTKLGAITEERIAIRGGQSGEASFLGLSRRVAE